MADLSQNTYGRNNQYTASVKRFEDAKALQRAGHWNGAIYLGGYAIECSLKALICYSENKTVLTETKLFKPKEEEETDSHNRVNLHNLDHLLTFANKEVTEMRRQDRSNEFNEARKTIIQLWKKDKLRYETVTNHKPDCERFIAAVEVLHYYIMKRLDVYRSKLHE